MNYPMLAGMQTEFLLPIILLLVFSTLTTILVAVLKLKFMPTFVIEILIGLAIASWFNQIVAAKHMEGVIEGLYVVGLSLMMFLSGYDAEVDVLKDKEHSSRHHVNILHVVLKIMLAVVTLSLIIGYVFSRVIFDKSLSAVLLMAILFSSTFAGLVSPLIFDQGLEHTVLGKIGAVFADLSELLSIIFLSIFMIVAQVTEGHVWVLFFVLLILVIIKVFPSHKFGSVFERVTGGIVHLPTRILVLMIIGMVYLSELSGGEYILGAFLLGMFAKTSGFKSEIFRSISRIVYGIFAPMFYIIVGTRINVVYFFQNPLNIKYLVLILLSIWIVRSPMLYLLKWFRLRNIIPMMLLTSSTIIVPIALEHIGIGMGIFTHEFGEAMILAGIITCMIPPIIFKLNFPFGECGEQCQIQFGGSTYEDIHHEHH